MGLEGEEAAKYVAANLAIDLFLSGGIEALNGSLKGAGDEVRQLFEKKSSEGDFKPKTLSNIDARK